MSNNHNNLIPKVPSIYVRKLAEFVQSKGIAKEVIKQHNTKCATLFDMQETFIPVSKVIGLIEAANFLLQDESSAFEFGQLLTLTTHGVFGYTLLSNDNYHQVVSTIVQHINASLPLLSMSVIKNEACLSIALSNNSHLTKALPFLTHIYLGSIYNAANDSCKDIHIHSRLTSETIRQKLIKLSPNAIWHFCDNEDYVQLYRTMKQPTAEQRDVSAIYSLIKNQLSEELLQTLSCHQTYTAKVTEHIINYLHLASLPRSADLLGLSARYLRFQLANEGTSFRELNRKIKGQFAKTYVRETPVDIKKIAQLLGFSDQASFTRAYRSWTGNTPGEDRENADF